MKQLLPLLVLITSIFFLSGCGQDKDPRAVYAEFNQSINSLSSVSDTSIDQFLTNRALSKKNEGMKHLHSVPKGKRAGFEKMFLGMLQHTSTWLDSKSGQLTINDNSATLVSEERKTITDGTETTTVTINFVKEDGWKIDSLTKKQKTVSKKANSEMTDSLFK